MKYQLIPENALEEKALKFNIAARPLFDPFLPVIQARSLMAGVRLGIFEAFDQEGRTAECLAQKLSLDSECLRLLLEVLVCAGYISRDKDVYSLTERSKSTLLQSSPIRLTGWMEYNYIHWRVIDKLEDVIKSGKGIDPNFMLRSPAEWAVCQQAMLETARPAARDIAALVPVKEGALKMLDIGGSHGLYGAMICRLHPPLHSEVLELPEAVEHARKLAVQEGIDDVVKHRSGDALTDDLGDGNDLVFLGNIIHHFQPDIIRQLLIRLKTSMTKGGTVAIWEFKYPDPGSSADIIGNGLSLFFRLTSNARCYRADDYIEWLKQAGFGDITIQPTPLAPSNILITGRI
ncbi:MAG: hypothetical protein GY839_06780 [candidate division Zixibacteria bacterium]|nr:hypothetical protein [candidate division Zixibacteria bacterium]